MLSLYVVGMRHDEMQSSPERSQISTCCAPEPLKCERKQFLRIANHR